jgi:toxin HigB-1
VIRSFRHAGLEKFFRTGSKAGIQPKHAARIQEQLAVLNVARKPDQMNVPGWHFHVLKGDLKGCWAVSVSGNWRMIFAFEGEDAILVDYRDYH